MPSSPLPLPTPNIASSGKLADWLQHVWQVYLSRDSVLIAVAFLSATIGIFCLEKLTANGGLGFDGEYYSEVGRDFYRVVFENPISNYRVQRVLPSCIIHYTTRLLGIDITDHSILLGYGILNIACITAMAWMWCLNVRQLGISQPGKWLGFFGLFFSLAIANHATYYVNLTDVPAMAIGMGYLCFYLARRPGGIMGLMLLGALTWPTLVPLGVLLVWFPKPVGEMVRVEPAPRRLNTVAALLAAYYLCMACLLTAEIIPGRLFGYLRMVRPMLWLSIPLSAALIYYAFKRLLDCKSLYQFPDCKNYRLWLLRAFVLCFAGAIKIGINSISTLPVAQNPGIYLLLMSYLTASLPGISYLSHVVYYGPLLLVMLFCWRETAEFVQRQGIGLTLAILLLACHSIDSESRHLVYGFPLLLPFIIQATELRGWTKREYGFLCALCVVFSKIWLPINIWGDGEFKCLHHTYPDVIYFMNHGPFMRNWAYLVQGIGALLALYWIRRLCIVPFPLPKSKSLQKNPSIELASASTPVAAA